MMKLLEFNFTIQYKKGAQNRVADALSRVLPKCMAISSATPVWAKDLSASYQQDQGTKKLLEQLLLQKPDTPSDYTIADGIIRYKGKILVGNLPTLRNQLLMALHNFPVGGHSGMRATYQRVKSIFYWPRLN